MVFKIGMLAGLASLVGLSLSYAFPLTGLLNGLLATSAETEQEMVSMERVREWSHLQPQVPTLLHPCITDIEGAVIARVNSNFHGPCTAILGLQTLVTAGLPFMSVGKKVMILDAKQAWTRRAHFDRSFPTPSHLPLRPVHSKREVSDLLQLPVLATGVFILNRKHCLPLSCRWMCYKAVRIQLVEAQLLKRYGQEGQTNPQ